MEQVPKPDCWYDYSAVDIKSCEAGVAILNSNSKEQASILVAASKRIDWVSNLEPRHGQNPMSLYRTVLWTLINNLLRRRLPLSESDLKQIKDNVKNRYVGPKELLRQARWCLEEHGLSSELREFLLRLRGDAVQLHKKEQARIEEEIDMLIGENKNSALQDGEAWANAALAELQALPQKESSAWSLLIAHCKSATAGKPSAKWVKEAHRLLDDVGEKSFAEHLQSWLKLFASHHEAVNEINLDALKGLVWCASLRHEVSMLRALAAVVPACVKNIEQRHTYEYIEQTHEHVTSTVRAPRLAN